MHRPIKGRVNRGEDRENKVGAKPNLWMSRRLTIMFCIFLAGAQMAMLRDNLGIALICMSKPLNNATCETIDAIMPTLPGLIAKQNCEFDWDPSTRGRILGAYLYGFTITTILSGFMSAQYSAKLLMMWGGISATFFHLMCPTAVLVHTELLFACRFMQGMASAMIASPCFELLREWMTEEESSTLISFGFSGFTFGTILTYSMSGVMCNTHFNGIGGWPLIYYAPASISILIVGFWYQYLYDSPQKHPNISWEENDYLLQNIDLPIKPDVTPWVSIFTSMPIIAYMVCYIAFLWNTFTMMSNIPMFMQSTLAISSKENGYLFCIPISITFFTRLFNGKTYPSVKNFLGLSQTACRKLYCTFGMLTVILSLLSIIFVQKISKLHLITALTFNLSIGDFAYTSGFFPTLLELAPNYAGLLSGITMFFAYLISCPTTLVNSIIVEQNTKEEWNLVLWIIVAIYTFSALFYLIFGSASLQTWSQQSYEMSPSSRSTLALILTQSFMSSRNVSLKHPVF